MSTKRAFEVKQKEFYITFKGLLVAKNCLRPESAPLKTTIIGETQFRKNLQKTYTEKKNPPKNHCEKFKAEPIRAKFLICHN